MQPDLFAAIVPRLEPRLLARTEAPATSHDAARSVRVFAADHHAAILAVLEEHGARGLTAHEVATFCRLDAHAIGKRTNELEAAGAIEVRYVDGKALTRTTPSGRKARVWFLAGKGAAA